jgi:hypothetical protein
MYRNGMEERIKKAWDKQQITMGLRKKVREREKKAKKDGEEEE